MKEKMEFLLYFGEKREIKRQIQLSNCATGSLLSSRDSRDENASKDFRYFTSGRFSCALMLVDTSVKL